MNDGITCTISVTYVVKGGTIFEYPEYYWLQHIHDKEEYRKATKKEGEDFDE